ncbi:MAG: hypothetical protein LBN32_02605 [Helicobacteraceae bacterium]|jgi:hypothetical protein|nr:hypothetical protein [Helicobacteraceae bacterium]
MAHSSTKLNCDCAVFGVRPTHLADNRRDRFVAKFGLDPQALCDRFGRPIQRRLRLSAMLKKERALA